MAQEIDIEKTDLDKEASDWGQDIAKTDDAETEAAATFTYEISNYPSDMPIAEYYRKWNRGDLIIPQFQRKFVWTQNDASKLIESFLMGLPVPGVFLYKRRKDNKLLVVDGQQRILSAMFYMKGLFVNERLFRLRNVREEWLGKSFDELDETSQRALEDSILRATIIQQLDPDDDTSIYHIFERLNTGGKNLNPMEVRRCVYSSPFVQKLEEVNEVESWRQLIGKPEPDLRYRDVEWVLRILSLSSRLEKYDKPMKRFLNDTIRPNAKAVQDDVHNFIEDFPDVCNDIFHQLGPKPFHLKGRLNYAVLDSVMATCLRVGYENAPDDLSERYSRLVLDEKYLEYVTANTSDATSVQGRFKLAKEYLAD